MVNESSGLSPQDPENPVTSGEFMDALHDELLDAERGMNMQPEDDPEGILVREATLPDGSVNQVLLGAIVEREKMLDEMIKHKVTDSKDPKYAAYREAVRRVSEIKSRINPEPDDQ